MAKATIKSIGDAFVVTAGFKLSTVQDLVKYGKDSALVLKDKQTKEPYFAVSVGSDTEISRFGITFTSASRDGYAECTATFPETSMTEEDKKVFLRENFAFVITHLNAVQEQIEAESKELAEVIATADSAITIN